MKDFQSMTTRFDAAGRLGLSAFVTLALLLAGPAWAQQKKPEKPAAAPAAPAQPAGPVLLGSFGDWGAYATDAAGKGRVCYVLSRPKERAPKELKRDDGYLFISARPSENVHNEISFVLGFPTKDGSVGELVIGSAKHALVTKGASAWLKNAAEDNGVVELMKKNKTMTTKTASAKGNATTDTYQLAGLAQALDRIKKECP
jgi:invasion protein IalB